MIASLPCTKPSRLEADEGEGLDIFLERHAILQPERDRDGEIVHQAPEGGALLVHVDEDLAEPPVLIFAGAQIDLVPADDGLLGIALAAVGQTLALAGALDPLDHALDDFFRNRGGARGRAHRDQRLDRVSSSSSSLSTSCAFRGCDSFEPSR